MQDPIQVVANFNEELNAGPMQDALPSTSVDGLERTGTDQHIISTEDTPAEPAESLLDLHSHPPM